MVILLLHTGLEEVLFFPSYLEGEEGAPPNSNCLSSSFTYMGSDAGLSLIQGNFTNSIYVCSPLTPKVFLLPLMILGRKRDLMKGEIGITKEGEDGYKGLVMDNSLHPPLPKVIEIYDSSKKVRKVAGRSAEKFNSMEIWD